MQKIFFGQVSSSTVVSLAGTLRTGGRLLAAGLVLLLAAAPPRTVERLPGATLAGKTAGLGTSRAVERLRGASLTGTTALAGTVRAVERLPSAEFSEAGASSRNVIDATLHVVGTLPREASVAAVILVNVMAPATITRTVQV